MGGRKQRSTGSKSVSSLHVDQNQPADMRAQTFNRGRSSLNGSFARANNRSLNQTMLSNKSQLDGSMMLEKKQNVKQSQQNMEQLKHRIDALKRNVELAQKKEAQAERERQCLEQGLRNRETKAMARMALEEERQRKVAEKKERVQSARKERAQSKKRAEEEHQAIRRSQINESKQMLAERRQALEAKERATRAKKLKLASEVKKSKAAAAAKRRIDQEQYSKSVHDGYQRRIQEQESIYSANQS